MLDSRKQLPYDHTMWNRIALTVALAAILSASAALPCLAAASSMDSAAPCEAPEAATTLLCQTPGTNAPLGVAPQELPASDVLVVAPGLVPTIDGADSTALPLKRPHPARPGPNVPAFLLHAVFLS